MDDGESWQSLQLNLPVTSVRDFEIYNGDIIGGTHGRGIWVIEDISPLRQLDATILASRIVSVQAHQHRVRSSGRRERNAAAEGRAARGQPAGGRGHLLLSQGRSPGPDRARHSRRAGRVGLRRSRAKPDSSAVAASRRNGIPRITAQWEPVPEPPLSTAAGLHRVVWPTIIPPSENPAAPVEEQRARVRSGAFSARLTVAGKSYTQNFDVTERLASE